ncbi:MAG: endonuclease/exonuclease/phosphatase family protein [Candidatus Planktophila sp.]
MRITSWNLLHGMQIPPQKKADPSALTRAVEALRSDFYALQEVDHFLPRSQSRPQMRDIAEAIGARDWAMGPSVMGTPGQSWRKKHDHEPEIISNNSPHSELVHESYGIGIVSKIPVLSWHRLNLGNAPVGLPLIVPGDETGKGKLRFIYVKDEPRLALAAVLSNGWTVVNTHLSFVPGFNTAQLRKLKRWALELAVSTQTRAIVVGDLNLPKNLPVLGSKWQSLVTENTYPSWSPKIQFDYILSKDVAVDGYRTIKNSATGVSDHLPLSIELIEGL